MVFITVFNFRKTQPWFTQEMLRWKSGDKDFRNQIFRVGPNVYRTVTVIGNYTIGIKAW